MGFDFSFGGSSARRKVIDKARILVLGDFAGAEQNPASADRSVPRIDWDNFDNLIRRFSPTVVLEHPAFSDAPPICLTRQTFLPHCVTCAHVWLTQVHLQPQLHNCEIWPVAPKPLHSQPHSPQPQNLPGKVSATLIVCWIRTPGLLLTPRPHRRAASIHCCGMLLARTRLPIRIRSRQLCSQR
jgi:hypothetical protein